MSRRDAEPEGAWYHCASSGKRGYTTRADARAARARTRGSRGEAKGKDGALSIYRCDGLELGGCGRYHVGHLPRVVVRGEADRSEVYRRPRDTPST